jgi:branched-subunit amino acid transport protein AzlD
MSATAQPTLLVRDTGPAVEKEVARDLVVRGLKVLPVAMVAGAVGWGLAGAASVDYAAALILANFWISAALLAWAARTSLSLLMGVSLFGFLVRLGAIVAAVLAVRDMGWVAPVPLATTLLVAHLGLLFWEARFVSASLAFPGLKPGPQE